MSVKSSTELMLYVVLTMPTLNKAYLLFIIYLTITSEYLNINLYLMQCFSLVFDLIHIRICKNYF